MRAAEFTRIPTESKIMSILLVRSRAIVTKILDRWRWEEISEGAVAVENGLIVAIGGYDDLRRKYRDATVVGTGNDVMLPAFVNAHHHVGLTPVQLGARDMPLELWWIARMVARNVDPYLDTLYSAFEMIASGVTTVQHIQGWLPGLQPEAADRASDIIRAYQDIGMRVSYSFALRDQNRLGYRSDEALMAAVPADLRPSLQRWFDRFKLGLVDQCELFETLYSRYRDDQRVCVQLAPANLHWCSDAALERIAQLSKRYDVPMHIHLLETAYQKEYAAKRGGQTALDYLDRFDMLGPRLTLGHGVWLNDSDIERIAETGTCICHNCSSNFRLRSGVAPLNRFEARGINTAIGIDEANINDDRDMLQEMRLVLRAHRVPGMDESDVPTTAQVLRMATVGGAKTTPFGDRIGTIEVGKEADFVLHDWKAISFPYLDKETSLLDAVLQRAKTGGVKAVFCAGEIIYENGRFTRVDQESALAQLHETLSVTLSEDELDRRNLAKALLPHAREFYKDYADLSKHEPYYSVNSRI